MIAALLTHLTALLSIRAIIVFIAAIVVDIVWGLYIRRSAEGRAVVAANYAVGIVLIGAINTLSFLHEPAFLIPMVAGNWIGTFAIIHRDHAKQVTA